MNIYNNVTIKIGTYGSFFKVLTLEVNDDTSFKICATDQQWYSYNAGTSLTIK